VGATAGSFDTWPERHDGGARNANREFLIATCRNNHLHVSSSNGPLSGARPCTASSAIRYCTSWLLMCFGPRATSNLLDTITCSVRTVASAGGCWLKSARAEVSRARWTYSWCRQCCSSSRLRIVRPPRKRLTSTRATTQSYSDMSSPTKNPWLTSCTSYL